MIAFTKAFKEIKQTKNAEADQEGQQNFYRRAILSILGKCNDISLRDSILLHVEDVSSQYIKRRINDHLLHDALPRYTTRMLCDECNIDIVY